MKGEIAGRAIESWAGMRALVLGDTMLDVYLQGSSRRLSQEAPVPVVDVERRIAFAGGAANTAANVAALGAQAWLLSVVGDDPAAQEVREALGAVSTEHLIEEPGRRTLTKQRIVSGEQIIVRIDEGGTDPVEPASQAQVIRSLSHLAGRCDVLIVSDYDYGVVTQAVLESLASLAPALRPPVMVDSKKPVAYRPVKAAAVKPNFRQAMQLLGEPDPGISTARVERITASAERLVRRLNTRVAAVTLDAEGALVIERGKPPYRTYTRPSPSSRSSGAGDTFTAALGLALAAGNDVPTAAELATAAAGVAVGKEGTATCTAAELRASLSGEKLVELEALLPLVRMHRAHGRRIVFTNGCFDILHRGHVTYLSRAKSLGDVLIVGVNTDASVRRLKGKDRPVNQLRDRVQVLAALSCVDHIVPFDDPTPLRLVEALRPEVFTKGGDYIHDMLPEVPLVERYGGTVEILPYVEDCSTSALIGRIRGGAENGEQRGVLGRR